MSHDASLLNVGRRTLGPAGQLAALKMGPGTSYDPPCVRYWARMKKIEDVQEILTPVEMRRVLCEDGAGGLRPITSHRVIVERGSGTPLGVVGAGYRLLTNEEALGFGRDCAGQLFGVTAADMEVFNVSAPLTLSFCHIDLVHRAHEVRLLEKEIYLPFVRVTNSYNTTRALRFDVGYCRKICLNGVIFGNRSIRFAFPHSPAVMRGRPNFEAGAHMLEALRESFIGTAERLMGFPVAKDDALALVFRGLGLPLPEKSAEGPVRETFLALRDAASGRVGRYDGELGGNAYAAFNAMTDFASHPPDVPRLRRSQHAMQAAAGAWAEEFGLFLKAGDFGLGAYLGRYRDVAGWN